MRQLAAVIWLRWRMWWHGLRSRAAAADTAVAIILALLGTVLSAVLAFVLAGVAHLGLMYGEREAVHTALTIVCWMLGFLAVVMPLIFGAGQPRVPLRRLLVFPLSRWKLYRVSLAATSASGVNLFWYPILIAVTLVAIVFDHAPPGSWTVIAVLFAGCLVVWNHTTLALAQWVLRKRNVRELAIVVGLVLLVIVSMLPAMFQERAEARGAEWFGELVPDAWTSLAGRVASVFPPSIAARGLESEVLGRPGTGLAIALVVLWTAAGLAVGYRVVRHHLLEGDRTSPVHLPAPRQASRKPTLWSVERLTMFPAEVRAVAAKELRYLVRSTTGKFNIVIMPVFVVVMALLVARDLDQPLLGFGRTELLFIGLMIYAAMFSNNYLFNAYAWEGAGVQSFFLSPAQPERIVLGKNLGVWIYDAMLGVECVVAFCLISGVPSAVSLTGGCLAFVASVGSATIVGNFLSPTMPVPRDISSITNSPSQTAVLATFTVLICNVVVIGGSLVTPALFGFPWYGLPMIALLIVAEIALYKAMLRSMGRLLERRREFLVEALQA